MTAAATLRYSFRFVLAAATPCFLLAATQARAEIIRVTDMLRGSHVTYAQCAAKPNTVWVTSYGRELCIRYYLSSAGGEGLQPLVFLQGDKLGVYNDKSRRFRADPKIPDVDFDTDAAERFAANLSKLAKAPAIYLARIGVDGSSGYHGYRKTFLELHAMNAALNAIKRRHWFTGFNLVGQSGGAKLVGGLLAMRPDIGCAVPGSGPLDSKKHLSFSEPASGYFGVGDLVPTIARSKARILVVTDPADERVSAELQTGFVRKLRQAGHQVEQFFVRATDPLHHGVTRYALLAAAGCTRGIDNRTIALKLAQESLRPLTAPRTQIANR